jgi:hypothetical protein
MRYMKSVSGANVGECVAMASGEVHDRFGYERMSLLVPGGVRFQVASDDVQCIC